MASRLPPVPPAGRSTKGPGGLQRPKQAPAPPARPNAPQPKQSEASMDLGQEGTESNIKRNTTGKGKRKDRGP